MARQLNSTATRDGVPSESSSIRHGRPVLGDEHPLSAIRARGVRLVTLAFWALSIGFVLILGNAYFGLVERWLRFLQSARISLGFTVPGNGPDWYLIVGLSIAVALPAAALLALFGWYRRYCRKRVEAVWRDSRLIRKYARTRRLPVRADARQVRVKADYLSALVASPLWQELDPSPALASGAPVDAVTYRQNAARALSKLEREICKRAITTGLAVGISRGRWVDLLAIAVAALEMQLFVLGRLGKKPSPRTWAELRKRTAASLFINTYLNREDAWAITLAVRKAAMGLEVAADAAEDLGDMMDDFDWDDVPLPDSVVGVPVKGALESMAGVTGFAVGVGTEGVRRLGRMIDSYSEEILQGVLAGGIIYYHGMAIAAECLALDREHRDSPEMNRTASQAASAVSVAAASLVHKQVQGLRAALQERRKVARAAKAMKGSFLRKFHRESRTRDDVAAKAAAVAGKPGTDQ